MKNTPSIMAEDREKGTMQPLPPTDGQPAPQCIADVAAHKYYDPLFKILLYLHSYCLSFLHLCLAIFVLFMFYKLWFTLKRRRPFIAVIHVLILWFAAFRVISIAATGHIPDLKVGFFFQLIGDLGIPALTSAYALTVWLMFEISNIGMSRKLQNKGFLAIVIVSHFLFVFVVGIVVGLMNGTCVLLLTCQILNVIWGLILTVLFITATLRICKTRHRQKYLLRNRAFSKPVLELTTGNLASVALPIDGVGCKEFRSTDEEDSLDKSSPKPVDIPANGAAKVFPIILKDSSPLVEDGTESTACVDDNDADFPKGNGTAYEKESTTSNIITTSRTENLVNDVELSTSDKTLIVKGQLESKEFSQSNGDVGKCDHYSDGKRGTSGNCTIEKTDTFQEKSAIAPEASQPKVEEVTLGVPEIILKTDHSKNIASNNKTLAPETKVAAQQSRRYTRPLRRYTMGNTLRRKFVSTEKKNPTKRLETVGIFSAILGVAQVLLGVIGTGYIYNPLLVGTDAEPGPSVWLLFTTTLRILELLFGLVLTFLVWQKTDSRTTNEEPIRTNST